MNAIPVRARKPGKYHFTQQDKEYIQSFAVNGKVPFNAYISAVNKILNGLAPHQVKYVFCAGATPGNVTPEPANSVTDPGYAAPTV